MCAKSKQLFEKSLWNNDTVHYQIFELLTTYKPPPLKIGQIGFWSQKMCNVLKRLQKQFSDFKKEIVFVRIRKKKIFMLRFWWEFFVYVSDNSIKKKIQEKKMLGKKNTIFICVRGNLPPAPECFGIESPYLTGYRF